MKIAIITILLVFILIKIITMTCFDHTKISEKTLKKEKESLYERIGGFYKISLVVDHLSNNIILNKIIGKESVNQQIKSWYVERVNKLFPFKVLRVSWLCYITGGPFSNPLKDYEKNQEINISDEEFNEINEEFKKSFSYFDIDPNDILDFFGLLNKYKKEFLQVFFYRFPKNKLKVTFNL